MIRHEIPHDERHRFGYPIFIREIPRIIEEMPVRKQKHWEHLNKGAYKGGKR